MKVFGVCMVFSSHTRRQRQIGKPLGIEPPGCDLILRGRRDVHHFHGRVSRFCIDSLKA